jgi:anti-sigma factor RsiW
MILCEDVRTALHLYIDAELSPRKELAIEAHLVECGACRSEYDQLREVVDTVRGSKPLYEPRPVLRNKVESMLQDAGRNKTRWPAHAAWLIAAALVIAALPPGMLLAPPGLSFTAYAADTHLRYAGGRLPLDVSSDQPHEVSAWLQKRLPFHLSVPQYPADSGEPKAYTLAGARLMQYGGDDIAYLAYSIQGRPVSLLVSSSRAIQPSGQEVLQSGKLLFHLSVSKGLKLITWRDRDLVYALVSDVQASSAQSCIVCHGSAAERSRFEKSGLDEPFHR